MLHRFAFVLAFVPTVTFAATAIRLRCEYLDNPLGVEAAKPRLSWELKADRRNERQTAYQVVVTRDGEMLWDTGKVESGETLAIPYAGKPIASAQQVTWKVRAWDRDGQPGDWSAPATWETGLLDKSGWHGRWIGTGETGASPLLRKTFDAKGPIKRARAYVSGLGYYELRLNGAKVGDRVLEPAFTNYDRRVLYTTYDVTAQLKQGKNAVGAMLGTGWYDVRTVAEWHFHEASWRDRPKLLVELRIDYADGSSDRVFTDETWKTAAGPITFDSVYCGENYDARREQPGWDAAGFDDAAWSPAKLVAAPKGKLVSQQMPPIRVVDTLAPKKITEPKPGVFIFDFGQNFAGVPQLTVDGHAGTTVKLRCAERVAADGTLDTAAIDVFVKKFGNEQFQEDRYTLRGDGGKEVYAPRFTYHGFQYIEVTGFPGKPTLANLRGLVLHTDLRTVGEFECSNDLLNKIWRAGRWSYLNNAHGYPTDCPTREKNGWTGDANLASETGLLNFDGVTFYEKWLRDLADAQWPEGDVPAIVPTQGWGRGVGPAWDAAYILLPMRLYEYTGDARVLQTHFNGMKNYVDYLTKHQAKDGIVTYGLGDWCPAESQTPAEVTSTAYYYRHARAVADAARILGQSDDAAKYSQLAESIKAAFNKKYFDAKAASYANGTQTALSCALYQGLVPPEQQDRVFANLLAAIEKKSNHLDTGILGAQYVMQTLLARGRVDVGYAIASQRTQPSWGWWIDQGATTLWEQWNGSDSRDHIMFGDVLAFFTKGIAGIQPDPASPGWKHVIIRPGVVGDLRSARGSYHSVHGRIVSSWTRNGQRFSLNVTIPPNVTATVYVPAADANEVSVNRNEGVTLERSDAGHAVFSIGSGDYSFTSSVVANRSAE
jgi:alpha-L-rhamnosidase